MPSPGSNPRLLSRAGPEELVLEIISQHGEITETLVALSQNGAVYLPLGEVARIFDLAITVSDGGNRADGWILAKGRDFSVDLDRQTWRSAGKSGAIGVSDAFARDGELYLREERWRDLLPMDMAVDPGALQAKVRTREPFPFEQRLAREKLRGGLGGSGSAIADPQWPGVSRPRRAFEWPMADIDARLVADHASGTRFESDIRASGDFAWLTARAYAGFSSTDGLRSANIELGRRSIDANLLGPLKATAFGMGDISAAGLPMGLATVNGRGLYAGNAPLFQASVFETTTISGPLPDGYEVELYRNGILIDSIRTAVDGQYRFQQVQVFFGMNQFKLVFYGPQGQRREEIRRFSVGDGRLAAGALQYAFSTVQKDMTLLGLHPDHWFRPPDYGSWRTVGLLRYGLTSKLTAAISGASYQRGGDQHWLTTLGLRSGLGGIAARVDLALGDGTGRAAQVGLAGELAGIGLTFEHGEYRGYFIDERRGFSDAPLRRATELSAQGLIRLGSGLGAFRSPIYAFVRNVEFLDGRKLTDVTLRQSVSLTRSAQLTNVIQFKRNASPRDGSSSQLSASHEVATFGQTDLHLRAAMQYDLRPRPQVRTVSLQAEHSLAGTGTVRASLAHYVDAHRTMLGASGMRLFGRFTLAIDASYTTHPGEFRSVLRLGFGLGRNPQTGRPFVGLQGMSNSAAASARAYRDNNDDGRFDEGDVPIPDVSLFTGNAVVTTDRHGLALVGNLGDGVHAALRLDSESLPDIALNPKSDGFRLSPRAGHIDQVEFPLAVLAQIDGKAMMGSDGAEKPISGLQLLLLSRTDGSAVARARTQGDGSFWFERIRHGNYRLSLDPGQAGRLRIRLLSPESLSVGPQSTAVRIAVKVGAD